MDKCKADTATGSATNPNVGSDDRYDFFALRDIKKDDELTADYSK